MKSAHERLQKYREEQEMLIQKTAAVSNVKECLDTTDPILPVGSPGTSGIPLPEIDVLDAWIFRKWRECYEDKPHRTMVFSLMIYILGQAIFIWYEFGLVYFILSLFLNIFLSLGSRSKEEVSAYSVFNENCERLPGQMTAEHFERDMLRRRQ